MRELGAEPSIAQSMVGSQYRWRPDRRGSERQEYENEYGQRIQQKLWLGFPLVAGGEWSAAIRSSAWVQRSLMKQEQQS